MTAAWPGSAHHDELRAALLAERERSASTIASLRHDLTVMAQDARLTVADDEHDPEGSTVSSERAKSTALLAQVSGHLADVDAALKKFTAGTYGRCEGCGEFISLPRLLARPASRTCILCAAST